MILDRFVVYTMEGEENVHFLILKMYYVYYKYYKNSIALSVNSLAAKPTCWPKKAENFSYFRKT